MDSDNEAYDAADGLSNIGAIPTKKTLMLVNNFITNTVDFMNKFANLCERKLSKISTQTQHLEITLNLLEAKLESVPWLDPASGAVSTPAPVETAPVPVSAPTPSAAPPAPTLDVAAPPVPVISSTAVASPAPTPVEPVLALTSSPVKDDPRYAPYFKMLRLGLPKPVVLIKMRQQTNGMLDESVLDWDPEAPAPPPTPGYVPPTALVPVDGDESD